MCAHDKHHGTVAQAGNLTPSHVVHDVANGLDGVFTYRRVAGTTKQSTPRKTFKTTYSTMNLPCVIVRSGNLEAK